MEVLMKKMFLLSVVLSTLVLVASTQGGHIPSQNSESEGNRYQKPGAKGALSPSTLAGMTNSGSVDATDRTQKMGSNEGVLLRTLMHQNSDRSINPQHRYASNSPKNHNDHRLKRSYYPYQSNYQLQWPQFQSLNTWRANLYPIQRPYFVPIYGYDGRVPLYYPQLTYIQNPVKPPYVGPTYLPPVGPTYLPPGTTESPKNVTTGSPTNDTTMMPIDDRFGDNDDDERPIWDNGNNGGYYPTTPKSILTPTRKTMSSTSTFPPLVHSGDTTRASNSNTQENEVATVSPAIPRPQGPSKCVWAIVSCCSTGSKDVSYECFDQLGCGGPFWDVNPCDTEYAKAAIQTALNYYNSRF